MLSALAGAIMTALITIAVRDLGRTENATTIVFWFSLLSMLPLGIALPFVIRSEEHTSELQSLMRISYAVFCLKKKNITGSDIATRSRLTLPLLSCADYQYAIQKIHSTYDL